MGPADLDGVACGVLIDGVVFDPAARAGPHPDAVVVVVIKEVVDCLAGGGQSDAHVIGVDGVRLHRRAARDDAHHAVVEDAVPLGYTAADLDAGDVVVNDVVAHVGAANADRRVVMGDI